MGGYEDDERKPRRKSETGGGSNNNNNLTLAVIVVGALAVLGVLNRSQLDSRTSLLDTLAQGWSASIPGKNATAPALDDAIEARRRSIVAIETQTAALKLEQQKMLASTQELAQKAAGDLSALRKEVPRELLVKELSASDLSAVEQQPTRLRGGRRSAPPAAVSSSKRKLARFYSRAGACSLAVYPTGSSDDSAEWLRCDETAPGMEAIFELTPSSSQGAVWMRSLANNKYVEVVPPGEQLSWVVRASLPEPPPRDKGRAEFIIFDGAYIRNVKTQACLNTIRPEKESRTVKAVRAHGNKPNNQAGAQKEAFSSYEISWLDESHLQEALKKVDDAAKEAQALIAAEEKALAQLSTPVNPNEKRVVSYGLYGTNTKYTTGAIRNSELVHKYFPGWVARFYCRNDVPREVIDELKKNGAEVVEMQPSNKGKIAGMFWRFLVADDPTVDRYIIRDSDSRLNPRERYAVEEWIASGKAIHTIRDHPNHDRPLNGGLWGGVKGAVPGMAEKVRTFSNKESYGGDLQFLNTVVWPMVKNNQLGHDAYTCRKYPNSKPFPTRRPDDYQHVGQVFSDTEKARRGDIDGYMRGRPIPNECRKQPEWKFG